MVVETEGVDVLPEPYIVISKNLRPGAKVNIKTTLKKIVFNVFSLPEKLL